jgi:uncharacterized protein with von Willebrand factor type A (vWA) domain
MRRETLPGGLVRHLARFARALRARGVEVGLGDEVDAARALGAIDLLDREDVQRALRIALKVRRRDWERFDEVFRALWTIPEPGARERRRRRPPAERLTRPGGVVPFARAVAEDDAGRTAPAGEPRGDHPGYSPEALLRKKPFDECSAADVEQLERVLERTRRRLATRPSRRLVPGRRGVFDLRRSFRRAVGTGGELVSPARRRRAIEEPSLVVLCDTSGSMDAHARFLLAFVLSLRRVIGRLEVFAFNTSLTRLTPAMLPGRIGPALDRLAAGVPGWSGGTRIGECLDEFAAEYAGRLVNDKTIVIVLSDGLDRGNVALVARAMRAIQARARKVIWLNPLGGDSRYQPTARAMQAALPFIDRLAPAHNLESLEQVLSELSS